MHSFSNIIGDRALALQTTDPLDPLGVGDDPLAMPQPQPLQSPGGSLGSLLGSPGAPQEALDLDSIDDDGFNQDGQVGDQGGARRYGNEANEGSHGHDTGRLSGALDARGEHDAQAPGVLGT